MANKPTVATAVLTPEQLAMVNALLAQMAAAKPAVAAKAVAAAKPATAAKAVEAEKHPVVAALEAGGAFVIRVGKAGATGSGKPRIWVDLKIGGVRVSGNAY